jgi:hypothetical protein
MYLNVFLSMHALTYPLHIQSAGQNKLLQINGSKDSSF